MTGALIQQAEGLVARPGDTLIIRVSQDIAEDTAALIKSETLARLPDLADVVVIVADQVLLYRPGGDVDG